MANITQILGTDSLSSSRIVINGNFDSVKTELANIAALLNTQSESLTLGGSLSASSLSIAAGGSNLLIVNSTNIISSVEHAFESGVRFEGRVQSSVYGDDVNPATVLPTAGNWEHETYFVATGTYSLTNALQGQNVTLITAGGDLTLTAAEISGQTTDLVVPVGTAVSLRFLGASWYIV